MSRKQDMYINYKRSNKRRGRKRKNWGLIVLAVILAIGVGLVALYILRDAINIKDWATSAKVQREAAPATATPKPSPTLSIAPTATPSPSPTPEPTPTPKLTPTAVPVKTVTEAAIQVKGIYVTSLKASSTSMSTLIDIAETTEINSLVIDIKDDHGKVSYQMEDSKAKEIGAVTSTIKDIKKFTAELKEKDIYLIARIVAFKDPYLAAQCPELAIKNPDGTAYRDNNGDCWVNPYNKKVWDYLIEIASSAAENGFDEIQFDYIRFSTGDGIDKADFGKEAKKKSKQEVIIEFTKYAYEHLKPLGVFVSADVYGTIISSSIDAGLVGQNYVEMAKHLDYICPMIYPSHFGEGNYGIEYPDLEPQNIIRKVLTASAEKLSQIPEEEHKAIVRPWLQDFTATWVKHHQKYGEKELREQITGVYEAGYEEWLLWNAGGNYSVKGLIVE